MRKFISFIFKVMAMSLLFYPLFHCSILQYSAIQSIIYIAVSWLIAIIISFVGMSLHRWS